MNLQTKVQRMRAFRMVLPWLQQGAPQPTPHTEEEWPSLFEETRDMIEIAALIYVLAELRQLHDQGVLESDRGTEKILAENITEPIVATDVYKLIVMNAEFLVEKYGDFKYTFIVTALERLIGERRMIEQQDDSERTMDGATSQLVAYEDKNGPKEPVYGITVNHMLKRITVVFRGTVTLNDFIVDAKIRQTYIPNPVKHDDPWQPEKIGLHTGFQRYLFGEKGASNNSCKKIIEQVTVLLEQHNGYKLYVTGHSLGASIATLFSFHVASSCEDHIFFPVTCIPIASPKVGNRSFQKAFRKLEKTGRLMLLRVENSKDLVTTLPNPYTFRLFAVFFPSRMYRHVGVSLKLYKEKQHRFKGRHVDLQFFENVFHHVRLLHRLPSLVSGRANFLENHSCPQYMMRLMNEREALEPLRLNSQVRQFNSTLRSLSMRTIEQQQHANNTTSVDQPSERAFWA